MSKKSSTSNFDADEPIETVAAPTKTAVVESWQWDGSHDQTTWPEWLGGCSAHASGDHLKLTTAAGTMSAVKGEWITKDAEGNVCVVNDDPNAS